jgi:hypothetical protein
MKLRDVPTTELRRILRATERDAGPDSVEARTLRRELVKREHPRRQAWQRRREGDRNV